MNIKGIIFAVIIMLSFYSGTNFYIAKRTFQWFNIIFPNINGKIYAIVYIFLALSMFIGFSPIPYGIKRIINWIGSHWMGVYVYLLLFFILADLIILLCYLLKLIPAPIPKSVRFYAGLIVVVIATALVFYGKYNANKISFVSYDVQTNNKTLQGEIKIVLISDLHLGAVNSEKNLPAIVKGINDLKPDLVCITGDIFNDDINTMINPSKAIDSFKTIQTTYGVYGCPGNHDGGKTFNEMIRFLEQSQIKLLNDEHVIIDKRLVLIGRLDSAPIGGFGGLKRKDTADFLASIETDLPIVVMDHNPANIDQYSNKIDLILSGHTHKGQMFPADLITKAMFTVDYGHYRNDENSPNAIVTSGAGTWAMPMRIGTSNEIVSVVMRN